MPKSSRKRPMPLRPRSLLPSNKPIKTPLNSSRLPERLLLPSNSTNRRRLMLSRRRKQTPSTRRPRRKSRPLARCTRRSMLKRPRRS